MNRELLSLTLQHLVLVAASVGIAVAIGVPTGLLLARRPRLERPILALANVFQTVPSLALFGFLLPLPFIGGIGARTAIVSLVLYSLLPIIRNTVTGIQGVDRGVREAAVAMGMTPMQVLSQVELPLARGVILTGVRVATVIAVGVATIAAAIGAGGLGTYIFRGLRMNDDALILRGAVPAAAMALLADFAIGLWAKRAGKPRATHQGNRRILFLATSVAVVIAIAFFAGRRVLHHGGGATGGVRPRVTIGSKDFTESVILTELIAQALEARGVEVERKLELGGNLCHDALVAGRIDGYPEYTGTADAAILHHPPMADPRAVYARVKAEYQTRFSVEAGPPLGFRNDFAILVRGADARRLSLRTISDAARLAPTWHAGFGQDFMSRADGYPGFSRAYGLVFAAPPREMDLSLTYRALAAREIDLIAGNATDGLIDALDLFQLGDDKSYFPPYEALYLFRADAMARVPQIQAALDELSGAISTEEMRRMNLAADGKKFAPAEVARDFRARHFPSHSPLAVPAPLP